VPPTTDKSAFDALEPLWSCESRERVGGFERYIATGDGPKFMCGLTQLGSPCLVYNIGSNNVLNFEQAMHNLTRCEIHSFDPTLTEPYSGGAYSAFHAIGVKGWQHAPFAVKPLLDIIASLGHGGRRIDVLKIDCEGCEYGGLQPVFEAMLAGRLSVGQLLAEMHMKGKQIVRAGQSQWQAITEFFLQADQAGLRVFSKERNHCRCRGFKCVEFSLVDRLHACRAFVGTHCPSTPATHVCA
jgi:hypothetical protein